MFYWQCFKAQ